MPRDVTGKLVEAARSGSSPSRGCCCRSTARATRSAAPTSSRPCAHVLEDVRQAVEDWPKMRSKCLVLAAELEGTPPPGRRRRRGRARHPVPALDGRGPLHLPRLPRLHPEGDRRGRGPRAGHRLGPGPAALRPAARPGARRPQPAGVRRRPTSRRSSCSPRPTPAPRCTGSPTSTTSGSRSTTSAARSSGSAASSGSTRPRPTPSRSSACRSSPRRCRPSSTARASPPTATPARTSSRCSRATRATSSSRPASSSCTTPPWR